MVDGVLGRKLLRDLASHRGQVIAIALIMACGVAAFVCEFVGYAGLKRSRDEYYRAYRMADLWAPVRRAPRSLADDLAATPGVRRVEGRILFDVALDMPDVSEPCTGRAVSVPADPALAINALHLTSGRWFAGDGDREVILAQGFAREHGLSVGDRVDVILNNRKEALKVVGTALSPEYVYMIRGSVDILPDPVHFAILWLSTTFAESAFDFRESCNEFSATLDADASLPDVIAEFDRRLERYGSAGAYGRADQMSNRFLSDEIAGLRGSATLVPAVFLGIAAFVLHMLLARLVQTQRGQIAVFRAFGYGAPTLALHYVKFVLYVGVFGAGLGVAIGLWFGRWILRVYADFYQFPVIRFPVDPWIIFGGVGISLGSAVLGAVAAVRRVVALEPAEGLRPEAPRAFRRTLLERWGWLWRRLGFTSRMIARNIGRRRIRTAATVLGVSLAVSILALAQMMQDSIRELITFQFRRVEQHDLRVAFEEERSHASIYELRRMPGVRSVEPELAVAVEFRNGWRKKRTAVLGLDPDRRLHRLLDAEGRPVPLPERGLLLSRKLAEILGVRPGEEIETRLLRGTRKTLPLPVAAVVDDYMGASAYSDIASLARWIGESEALTGAVLLVDPLRADRIGAALKRTPAIAAAGFKDYAIESFEETTKRAWDIMNTVLSLFAGVIAFGVIYNAARIAMAEREREFGSMSVLGFTRREVSAIIFGENLMLAILAIPPGLALGALFGWLLVTVYDTDLYRIPFVFTGMTAWRSAVLVLLFGLVANLAVRRRLGRVDLVEVLKMRE